MTQEEIISIYYNELIDTMNKADMEDHRAEYMTALLRVGGLICSETDNAVNSFNVAQKILMESVAVNQKEGSVIH